MKRICLILLIAVMCGELLAADTLSLAGSWQFSIDRQDKGIDEKWFNKKLEDQIQLPGSMTSNNKGDDITLSTPWTGSIYDSSFYFNPRLAKYRQPGNIHIPFWLTPVKYYKGAAWYQKEITVPANWDHQQLTLFLERAHIETRLWIDDQEVGMQNSLVAPHVYDLTGILKSGKHRISLRIDNRIDKINPGPDSHSVTDHTQSNWNGIIGRIELQADALVVIHDLQVYPNIKDHTAKVQFLVTNKLASRFTGTISVDASSFNTGKTHRVQSLSASIEILPAEEKHVSIDLPMGDDFQAWSELHPALYRLTAGIHSNKKLLATTQTEFGMRKFTIDGDHFLINDQPVFLRGTVNNCEFPLTGFPAMDEAHWEKIFATAKSFGLNHMRFHSWCPPEAAFAAADRLGFYLQPEGPSWPNHGVSIGRGLPIDQYLYDETNRMMKYYGNHPSFCMLSGGNEPAGNQVQYLNTIIDYWKAKDNRRVYTGMSVGGSWPVVPNAEYQVRGGVRGLDWNKRPESISDFSEGLAKFKVPFIAHEMGQWCVFPDFSEINQYTGAFKAKNFELFQQDLADQGMADQAHDFLMASGKLQLLCYKNEIEKTLRTPGYDGFQLLGLQDFPGQGTALVGVLNAFWQPKPYVSAALFSRFCNTTVPLLSLLKFVFSNTDTLKADVEVSHTSGAALSQANFVWTIRDDAGKELTHGNMQQSPVAFGNGIYVGTIEYALQNITRASRLNIEVRIANTAFVNDWNVWVYPAQEKVASKEVYYTTSWNDSTKALLNKGGKVFLNIAGQVVKGKEVAMHFLPVFWNTSWFKMRPPHVTGMLIQSKHPAFKEFPTEYHSDLQWWEIANRAQVMNMEDFPMGYKPLVQPIDTWFLNRRLGLLAEVNVGKGKLVVCSADIGPHTSSDKPAARQLYKSLVDYMNSTAFAPTASIQMQVIDDLLSKPSRLQIDTYTKDSPDELKPKQNNQK